MTLPTFATQTTFGARVRRREHLDAEIPELLAPLEVLLARARDPGAPAARRLRSIAALGRRVDALFQARASALRASESGESGARARLRVRRLLAEAHALLARHVLPARGVALRPWNALADGERKALASLFAREVSPVLTPLTVDATHPFPCVASRALCLAVLVRGRWGAGERYVGIEVPPAVPRFLATPAGALVAIEELVGGNLESLLGGEVVCHHPFRATRDDRPLRSGALGAGARTRAAVRLEVDAATPRELRRLLAAGLGLDPEADVDESPCPLDLAAVAALAGDPVRFPDPG